MTTQTMQQAAAHHFGIAWDELSPFEQAHWEAAYRAGRAGVAAENERLQNFETAYKEFSDKTDWVQETVHWSELGKHRADVLKGRIEQLKAENEALRKAASQRPANNTGHGHVFPRPDGVRARCGGPAMCSQCALDLARKEVRP